MLFPRSANICWQYCYYKLTKLFYLHCSCKGVDEKLNLSKILPGSKMLWRTNQEILKAPKITRAVGKLFNYCAHSWQGFAEGAIKVVFITVLCFKWSRRKQCVVKILRGIWERFLLCKNHRNYNSCQFSYKFPFIPCLSFRRNQKQESNF